MSVPRIFAISSAIFFFGAITVDAQASTLSFELLYEFSGATPPDGSTPWLTATLDDGDTAGSVDLTLETTNLVEPEHVKVWLFNLDPAFDKDDLALLSFSAPTKTGSFASPTISIGIDQFKADGDGYFDIEMVFSNAASQHFGVGEKLEYTITGIPSLTVDSFDCGSASGGGTGVYPTAAHVGSTGPTNEQSGWISVPEPSCLCLLSIGALGLIVGARRRRV
jgi:hypothetical protein